MIGKVINFAKIINIVLPNTFVFLPFEHGELFLHIAKIKAKLLVTFRVAVAVFLPVVSFIESKYIFVHFIRIARLPKAMNRRSRLSCRKNVDSDSRCESTYNGGTLRFCLFTSLQ